MKEMEAKTENRYEYRKPQKTTGKEETDDSTGVI